MKIKLAIAASVLALSTSAMAEDTGRITNGDLCQDIGEKSAEIMKMRQKGYHEIETWQAYDDLSMIVIKAYNYPDVSWWRSWKMVEDFRTRMELTCAVGGMRLNSFGGVGFYN